MAAALNWLFFLGTKRTRFLRARSKVNIAGEPVLRMSNSKRNQELLEATAYIH